jgi:enoyl-CoA hydratase/carnithine racemase
MMSYETILCSIDQGVARLTLNRPDKERDAQRDLGKSADYAEGVAAFAGKRTPHFTGS